MTESVIQAINYIAKTEGFRNGQPHFADRHLAVEVVVHSIVNLGASVEDAAEAFDLTPAQVYAALAYYHDHVDEFKTMWSQRDQAWAEFEANRTPAERAFEAKMLAKLKANREQDNG